MVSTVIQEIKDAMEHRGGSQFGKELGEIPRGTVVILQY